MAQIVRAQVFESGLPRHGHRQLIKPIPLRRGIPGGFCRDDFLVDHHARTMTCPAGITVAIAPKGQATFGAKCTGCDAPRALHHITAQSQDDRPSP